jgi:hypothetical protein
MKRVFLLLTTVFVFLAAFNPARGELVDRKSLFIAGGGLGLHSPINGELGGVYRDGFHYYVKGGFGIASHFSLMGEYGETWYRVVLEYKSDDKRTYKFRYISAGARYNVISGAYIIPYVEGLVGVTHFRHATYISERVSAVKTDIFPIAIGTFGTEFFVSHNWCIEGSIELYRVFGDVYLQPQLETDPGKSPFGRNIRPLGFHFRGGFLIFL